MVLFFKEDHKETSPMLEIWRAGGSTTTTTPADAQRAEAEGWDGQMFMDSQSLSADPYVRMGAWAVSTGRLKLCTGVTNPLTRHPAVTAAAAATVHAMSRGRAVLGIGRGDSALAYLGHAPASLASFRKTLSDLQALLSGEEIAFACQDGIADAPSLQTMSLGHRPHATKLNWLPKDLPKVPLDVAATGPKIIEMAAEIAEQITFSVGAIPERIAWAVDLARAARARSALRDAPVSLGAQLIVVCHPDIDAVRAAATSFVTPLARFQVIQGPAAGPQTATDSTNLAAIRASYDMTKHGEFISDEKLKGAALSWDFVERFAIVGPPDYCVERLLALHRLGLDRLVIVGPGFHPEAGPPGSTLFASEVLPALKQAVHS